jgi:hypothetical protein
MSYKYSIITLAASYLLFIFGCSMNSTFMVDKQKSTVVMADLSITTDSSGINVRNFELELPISQPSTIYDNKNGLVVISGYPMIKKKVNKTKTKIVVYDVVADNVLWSSTGKYVPRNLYNKVLMLKNNEGNYLAVDPVNAKILFSSKVEPMRYNNLEDMLFMINSDSIMCYNINTGLKKWSVQGAYWHWNQSIYNKDRYLILYGDAIQTINTDTGQNWKIKLSNYKVHEAEAMAKNIGICLATSCLNVASAYSANSSGSYVYETYNPEFVTAKVTHDLGSQPLITQSGVFFAEASRLTFCKLDSGNIIWQYDFSSKIQPCSVELNILDENLLVYFTGTKQTDNMIKKVGDPEYLVLNSNTGEKIWEGKQIDSKQLVDLYVTPSHVLCLYSNEISEFDNKLNTIATIQADSLWGDFVSFDSSIDTTVTVNCLNGKIDLALNGLNPNDFTTALTDEQLFDKPVPVDYSVQQYVNYNEPNLEPGGNGLKEIEIETLGEIVKIHAIYHSSILRLNE